MDTSTVTGHDVVLKTVGPVHVAGIHDSVPGIERMGDTFDRLFGILEEYVRRNGRATGPSMAIYHDSGTGPRMENMHVELAIPFEGSAVAGEQVTVYDLPGAAEMACTIHKGPFEEIGGAYEAVLTWARENGYTPAGPMRDVYLTCGDGDSATYMTEVQFPVTR